MHFDDLEMYVIEIEGIIFAFEDSRMRVMKKILNL